jgi:hypothetical protein
MLPNEGGGKTASSLDGACGIHAFLASMFAYSVALHAGYFAVALKISTPINSIDYI